MQRNAFRRKKVCILLQTYIVCEKSLFWPKTKEMPKFWEILKIWVTGENLGKMGEKGENEQIIVYR